jgi:hypothetical protein
MGVSIPKKLPFDGFPEGDVTDRSELDLLGLILTDA